MPPDLKERLVSLVADEAGEGDLAGSHRSFTLVDG
jgi:hypothetical protein